MFATAQGVQAAPQQERPEVCPPACGHVRGFSDLWAWPSRELPMRADAPEGAP